MMKTPADSLLCLLPYLVGDALQHTTTAAKCFAWTQVSQELSGRDPRSLKLHAVPGCRFVQHESLNHCVTMDTIRRFLSFAAHNS